MVRIKTVLILAGLILLTSPGFAEKPSFRERLIASGAVDTVIPTGDHTTYITDAGAVWNIYPVLVRIGLADGGIPEVLVKETDPFTRAAVEKWIAVVLHERNGAYYYYHPQTGKEWEFGYGRMYTWDDPMDESRFPPMVRMRGVYQMMLRTTADPIRAKTSSTVTNVVSGLHLLHVSKEPFVYLGDFDIPQVGHLLAPPKGLSDVTNWPFYAPDRDAQGVKAKGKKIADFLFRTNEHRENPRLQSYPELQYMPNLEARNTIKYYLGFGGLCAQQGENPTLLLRVGDQISVPTPARVINHFTNKGGSRNTDFILSCPSDDPFAVIIQTDGYGQVKAYQQQGTTAEKLFGIGPAEIGPGGPEATKAIRDEMRLQSTWTAQQAAKEKRDVRKTINRAMYYHAFYHGEKDGCAYISVVNPWYTENPLVQKTSAHGKKEQADIWNYLICNKRIRELDVPVVTKMFLTKSPGKGQVGDSLDYYVKKAAWDAYNQGASDVEVGNYRIQGYTFNTFDLPKCTVGVKVFEGMEMIYEERIYACP